MRLRAAKIFRHGVKELRSLRSDPVLMFLIVYMFSYAVYAVAHGVKWEVENAAVAVVDEDHSELSRRIAGALLPPYFKPAVPIEAREIDPAMDSGRFVFVVEIPPKFEYDVLDNRNPELQIDVDATAMSQAGNGAGYVQSIVLQEVRSYLGRQEGTAASPINLVVRVKFNPNLKSVWFTSVMQVINNITMLAVILSGGALIREREHGTIEHLLVMPVTPVEIILSKIWANGLVIVVAATLSLVLVVQILLKVPIAGSLTLFVAGTLLYQFSVTALGILLATFTGTMGQFGLLAIPVLIVLNLLSKHDADRKHAGRLAEGHVRHADDALRKLRAGSPLPGRGHPDPLAATRMACRHHGRLFRHRARSLPHDRRELPVRPKDRSRRCSASASLRRARRIG